MQTYNQFNQGNIMPLLMNFTTPSSIQESGSTYHPWDITMIHKSLMK